MISSKFFITHPRFACVIAIIMVLLGALAILVLPISQYPNITPPQVIVSAYYPGASSQVLLETVAIPIENEINGIEDMLYMSSTSNDNGNYKLTITFNIGTDPNIAQVKVQNRLQQVESILPDVVKQEGLDVKQETANMLGMLVLKGKSNNYSDLFLSNYAYTNLKNPISRIDGISEVTIYGPQNSMRIWVDPRKLNALNLSTADVVQAIEQQNIQASIGSLGTAPSTKGTSIIFSLSSKGLLKTVEDFNEIVVSTDHDGGIIRLKDIAFVEIGADTYQMSSYFNDKPAVILALSQTPNTNALDIMKNVRKQILILEKHFTEDLELSVVYDSTDFVRASIEGILDTLVLTFILVVLVVYIFLQNFKATLVPMITIPVSLIATFGVIYIAGFDINILTLFAMILAIGLVVDDAIIVVERVQYLMKNRRMDSVSASIQAMEDIGGAVIATTLVLLSIFIPVGLMVGITGKIYQQFALTIATAVVFSSVNALTLSPVLCSMFLADRDQGKFRFFSIFNEWLEYFSKKYIQGVRFFCRHLVVSFVISLVVIGGIIFSFVVIPMSFVPEEDQGIIFASIQLTDNASKNRTEAVVSELAQNVLKEEGVSFFVSVIGASLLGGEGENIAMGVIGLKPWKERTKPSLRLENIMKKLRQKYADNVNADIQFYALPSIPGVGNSDGLSFQLNALDTSLSSEELYQELSKLLAYLNTSDDFTFGFSTFSSGSPHIYLDIDRTKLDFYRVSLSSLFSVLQENLGSQYINNITLSGQVNKVIVQADFQYRKSVQDIKNLYVLSKEGVPVKLDIFLNDSIILQPKILYRYNQYLTAPVTAQSSSRISTGEAISLVEKYSSSFGERYGISWTGLSLQEVESSGLVFILIMLALIFSYLFLVALYESWIVSLSVIFTNIFAVFGALLGLFLLDLHLSIYAQLGIVLLIGLASKNAILIVEFILDERSHAKDEVEACLNGAKERFRAVLMTALTFILGVMPMLFVQGAGAASQHSIGTTVFFGMLFATMVGIFFIPSFYLLCDRLTKKSRYAVPVPRLRKKRKKM